MYFIYTRSLQINRSMKRLLLLILLCFSAITQSAPLTAHAWAVTDAEGRVFQSENIHKQRSIASITKLMTSMVVLDAQQDMSEKIGKYTRHELLQLAIVKSDNDAATALCKNYPGGRDFCVTAMNSKARDLQMPNTHFVDGTGLGVMNISTGEDLIKMVMAAKEYSVIVAASQMSEVKIKEKKKWLLFHNTNPIIGNRYQFWVSKTGYIRASGGCIVMMLDTQLGRRIVVILGSKSTHTRIPEAELLAKMF
jgi:D-alanyl-D-alanine endopeptidase (penicillin-binding protein 7)